MTGPRDLYSWKYSISSPQSVAIALSLTSIASSFEADEANSSIASFLLRRPASNKCPSLKISSATLRSLPVAQRDTWNTSSMHAELPLTLSSHARCFVLAVLVPADQCFISRGCPPCVVDVHALAQWQQHTSKPGRLADIAGARTSFGICCLQCNRSQACQLEGRPVSFMTSSQWRGRIALLASCLNRGS